MPNRERPPLGTNYWENYFRTTPSVVEDFSESEEDDTRPLEYVSLYYELMGKLDLVQLKLENYDSESHIAWDFFNTSDFSFLNPDFKEFLRLDADEGADSKIAMSVYHESGRKSWLSIAHDDRRVKFEFNEVDKRVRAKLQIKHNDEWVGETTVTRNVRIDVSGVLELVGGKLELVNRASSA